MNYSDKISSLISQNILENNLENTQVNSFVSKLTSSIEIECERMMWTKTYLQRESSVDFYSIYHPQNLLFQDDIIDTSSISKIFLNHQHLLILGQGGTGKTTLLRHLFINCIVEDYKIPIWLTLRQLNGDTFYDPLKYISEQIFHLTSSENELLIKLFTSGSVILFIDGFDEVNYPLRSKLIQAIQSLAINYSKCNILLSSRPHITSLILRNFSKLKIHPFTSKDIQEFIQKQVSDENISAKIFNQILAQKKLPYSDILKSPLLLSVFILIFEHYSEIPKKQSSFYRSAFDALYSHHDVLSKSSYQREKKSELTKSEFEELISTIAFITLFEEVYQFTEDYFNAKLKTIASKFNWLSYDSNDILHDLYVTIGILNRDGEYFQFIHQSMQEYFAAVFVCRFGYSSSEVFYIKILESNKLNYSSKLESKLNFYELLSELDTRNLFKYLIIPFLSNILKDTTVKSSTIQIHESIERITNLKSKFSVLENEFPLIDKYWEDYILYYLLHQNLDGNEVIDSFSFKYKMVKDLFAEIEKTLLKYRDQCNRDDDLQNLLEI